jgi:hypothetical protein
MNRVCNDFNPITIGISNESNVVHFPVFQPLYECDTFLLKTFASFFDIVYRHTNVSESFAGFLIATGISLELRVGFSAMVAELKS